jgi:hypothetical protein
MGDHPQHLHGLGADVAGGDDPVRHALLYLLAPILSVPRSVALQLRTSIEGKAAFRRVDARQRRALHKGLYSMPSMPCPLAS